jgi:hypothetical protein
LPGPRTTAATSPEETSEAGTKLNAIGVISGRQPCPYAESCQLKLPATGWNPAKVAESENAHANGAVGAAAVAEPEGGLSWPAGPRAATAYVHLSPGAMLRSRYSVVSWTSPRIATSSGWRNCGSLLR